MQFTRGRNLAQELRQKEPLDFLGFIESSKFISFTNTEKGRDMMMGTNRMFALLILVSLSMLAGCARSTSPIDGQGGMPSVSISAAFSKGSLGGLMKGSGIMATDSLQIDSAIVVFQRIKFEMRIDSVQVDSMGHRRCDDGGSEQDLIFAGPFVVHVRDTMTITFATQLLPPGVYDGVTFNTYRIGRGERHEDSDEFNHHPSMVSDSSFAGSSIVVWGKVSKNGTWVPYTYHFNDEVQYKLKDDLTVPVATSSVNVVLRFSMDTWFRNPYNGALLDPTDGSWHTQGLINSAIRRSFQGGKCGRVHDGWFGGH